MPLENRLCIFCEKNCPEDEIYICTDCEVHSDQLDELYEAIHQMYPEFSTPSCLEKFCILMKCIPANTVSSSRLNRRKQYMADV